MILGALLLACRGEVERGEPATGGAVPPGWQYAVTYDWGWLDLSRHGDRESALGPSSAELHLGEGWGRREAWGRWALAPEATVDLSVEVPGSYELWIEARSARNGDPPIEVELGDRRLDELKLGTEWKTVRLPLAGELPRGPQRIRLVAPTEQHSTFLTRTHRSAGVRRIGLVASGSRRFPDPGTAGETTEDGESVALTRSSTHLVPLLVPRDATTLSLTTRFEAERRRQGKAASLMVEALTTDGRRNPLDEVKPNRAGSTVHHRQLDLSPFRGRSVALLLTARLPARGASVRLEPPRLHRGADPGPQSSETVVPGGPRPNIVLIILDAARTDAFGLYGAARDTTPVLDTLAEEALVFTQATADCPYTLCSSPTILTGLSFLRHGVIDRGLRLHEEVPTLAGQLTEAGYHTIGLTSNPNNSQRTGTDRGFEVFRDTWQGAGPRRARDPERLHGFAVEALDEAPDDRPFFLMAHYVPPHEPYDPEPEFDLYSDPDYKGVVTRNLELQQKILRGEVDMGQRDVEQLRALYDGNLRRADAWVGRLLAELERRGELENSVLVVTSDHGEAFAEHGQFGHSSTVYEEMMRVPLIVRLPVGWTKPGVDLDRLVSLADITPTLLRIAGGIGSEHTDGVDLLAPGSSDRVVYQRSSQAVGNAWAARTRSHKAVLDPRRARLFDLERDDGETRGDVVENLALFHALTARLEAAVARAGRGTEEGEAMDPEEVEMLRALGYL